MKIIDKVLMKTGIELITVEQQRQIDKEGWTPEHDDEHGDCQMAIAAACYADHNSNDEPFEWPDGWPWKPTTPIRNLEKAGALIAAEIDRLLRIEKQE